MTTHEGHCHCGAVQVFFDTEIADDDVQVRACQCGFCRRRGAMTVSDPDGRMEVRAAPGALRRYQFGLGITDFLLCRECGDYVAAVMAGEGGMLGVVNVLGAGMKPFADRAAEPVDYDGEAADSRADRRLGKWTPALVVEAQPSA